MVFPVGAGQTRDRYPRLFISSVDELAVANVDAVVRKPCAISVLKEDKISSEELIPIGVLSGLVLGPDIALDRNSGSRENKIDET